MGAGNFGLGDFWSSTEETIDAGGTMGAAECVECGRKCTEDERSESEGTFERSENPKGAQACASGRGGFWWG